MDVDKHEIRDEFMKNHLIDVYRGHDSFNILSSASSVQSDEAKTNSNSKIETEEDELDDSQLQLVEVSVNRERKKYERKNFKYSSFSSSSSSSNIPTQLHKCNDCSRSFKDVNNYKEHRFQEHGITEYSNIRKCGLCSYATLLKSKYDCHMRCHMNNKVIRCGQCDYSTINIRHMSRHERLHMRSDASLSVQISSWYKKKNLQKNLSIFYQEAANGKLTHAPKKTLKSKHSENVNLREKLNKKKLKMILMAKRENFENCLPQQENSNETDQKYFSLKGNQSYTDHNEKCLRDAEQDQKISDISQNRLHPLHYDLLKSYLEILNQNKNLTTSNEQFFATKDDNHFPNSLYVNCSSGNEKRNSPAYDQIPQDGQNVLTVPSHSSNVVTPPSSASSIVSSPMSEHHQSQSNRKPSIHPFHTNQPLNPSLMHNLAKIPSKQSSNMLTSLNAISSYYDTNLESQIKLQGLKSSNQLLSSQIASDLVYNSNKQPAFRSYELNLNNENRLSMNPYLANSKTDMASSECNLFSSQYSNLVRCSQTCVHKAELSFLRKNLFLMFASSMPHVIDLFNLDPSKIENTTQIDQAIIYLIQNQNIFS